eukprot:gene5906-9736_t
MVETTESVNKSTLLKFGVYPKVMAASLLGMSMEELTEACKVHGIKRWPYHSTKGGYTKFSKTPFSELVIKKETIELEMCSEFMIHPPSKKKKTMDIKKEPKGLLSYILDQ